MPRALRAEQFLADEICIVHCVERCVRRVFLAGSDPLTGNDFSYRREWIRLRMEQLASVFGIDILTYAIHSNHLYIVLRNRTDVVAHWSDRDVAYRWLCLFPGADQFDGADRGDSFGTRYWLAELRSYSDQPLSSIPVLNDSLCVRAVPTQKKCDRFIRSQDRLVVGVLPELGP